MELHALHFVDAAAEDAHRLVVVFVLATTVLAFHFDARGQVDDADGRFGLVHMLATGTTGAHPLPLDVFIADLDLDLVGFGEDGDGRGGGVDAPLGFGFGDALDAVSARFELEPFPGIVAFDGERDFLEAAMFPGAETDFFGVPPLGANEAGVHLIEIAREQRRLVPAGSGADFDDHAVVGFPFGEEKRFDLVGQKFEAGIDTGQIVLGHRGHFGIGLVFGHEDQILALGDQVLVFDIGDQTLVQGAMFLGDLGQKGPILGDLGVGKQRLKFGPAGERPFKGFIAIRKWRGHDLLRSPKTRPKRRDP